MSEFQDTMEAALLEDAPQECEQPVVSRWVTVVEWADISGQKILGVRWATGMVSWDITGLLQYVLSRESLPPPGDTEPPEA